jgi:hypothetical protein
MKNWYEIFSEMFIQLEASKKNQNELSEFFNIVSGVLLEALNSIDIRDKNFENNIKKFSEDPSSLELEKLFPLVSHAVIERKKQYESYVQQQTISTAPPADELYKQILQVLHQQQSLIQILQDEKIETNKRLTLMEETNKALVSKITSIETDLAQKNEIIDKQDHKISHLEKSLSELQQIISPVTKPQEPLIKCVLLETKETEVLKGIMDNLLIEKDTTEQQKLLKTYRAKIFYFVEKYSLLNIDLIRFNKLDESQQSQALLPLLKAFNMLYEQLSFFVNHKIESTFDQSMSLKKLKNNDFELLKSNGYESYDIEVIQMILRMIQQTQNVEDLLSRMSEYVKKINLTNIKIENLNNFLLSIKLRQHHSLNISEMLNINNEQIKAILCGLDTLDQKLIEQINTYTIFNHFYSLLTSLKMILNPDLDASSLGAMLISTIEAPHQKMQEGFAQDLNEYTQFLKHYNEQLQFSDLDKTNNNYFKNLLSTVLSSMVLQIMNEAAGLQYPADIKTIAVKGAGAVAAQIIPFGKLIEYAIDAGVMLKKTQAANHAQAALYLITLPNIKNALSNFVNRFCETWAKQIQAIQHSSIQSETPASPKSSQNMRTFMGLFSKAKTSVEQTGNQLLGKPLNGYNPEVHFAIYIGALITNYFRTYDINLSDKISLHQENPANLAQDIMGHILHCSLERGIIDTLKEKLGLSDLIVDSKPWVFSEIISETSFFKHKEQQFYHIVSDDSPKEKKDQYGTLSQTADNFLSPSVTNTKGLRFLEVTKSSHESTAKRR